jgi:hypothetical protein
MLRGERARRRDIIMTERTLTDPIITATVDAFSRMSGISRDLVYDMLKQGCLDSIKIGRKRLIVIASYHRYIDGQLNRRGERK